MNQTNLAAALLLLTSARVVAAPQATSQRGLRPGYVPADAVLCFAARPAELLRANAVAPMAKELDGLTSASGAAMSGLELWSLAGLLTAESDPKKTALRAIAVVRARKPSDLESVIPIFVRGKTTARTWQGVTYQQGTQSGFFRPDDRTIVFGETEAVLKEAIAAGPDGAGPAEWTEHWERLEGRPAGLVANIAGCRDQLDNSWAGAGPLAVLAPAWRNVGTVSAWPDTKHDLQVRVFASTVSEEAGTKVERALQSALEIANAAMAPSIARLQQRVEQGRKQNGNSVLNDEDHLVLTLLSALQTMSRSTNMKRTADDIRVDATLSFDEATRTAQALKPLLARQWWRVVRRGSRSDLLDIAVALHRYHDDHGTLPPSAGLGKDGNGRHPVSWRVLLLPYLGEDELFEQYDFEQPWDSPHNTRVTAKIPAVYRVPGADPSKTETCYFGAVGAEDVQTAFGLREGRDMDAIIDGWATTLLVIQTRRDAHWAKPEDITCDPSTPATIPGDIAPDGFRAVTVAGDLVWLSKKVKGPLLRATLTGNGREVYDHEILGEEPIPEGLPDPKRAPE